jgi:hypothetical protein
MRGKRYTIGIAVFLWSLTAAGPGAHAEARPQGGAEVLPASASFRKVVAELFPEYPTADHGTLLPSKPGLPKVGIVAGLEKPWRRIPGQSIVALQVVHFEKGYSEVKSCPDTALAVVRASGKGPEILARSILLPGLPRDTGKPIESFHDCRKITEIDTADYRLADGDTTFGLRLRHDELTKTEASYRETLALYRVSAAAIRPVLATESETCDCATSGYHGCGKLERPSGKCEPADGSEYRKVYLKILTSKTKGMNEIARLEERVPGEKPAEAGVFRWDGEQYQLAPPPPAP